MIRKPRPNDGSARRCVPQHGRNGAERLKCRMKIAIDLQAAQTPSSRQRGIGRASLALVQSMVRHPRSHDIHLVLNEAFFDADTPLRMAMPSLPDDRFHWFSAPPVASMVEPFLTVVGEQMRERFVRRLNPDLIHIASLFEGLGDAARGSIDTIPGGPLSSATLYDLIPYLRPDPYLVNPVVRSWYYQKLHWLKRADVLLAISDYARHEAIDALGLDPERVVAISCGADPLFRTVDWAPGEADALRARYGLTRPFVMYTGGDDDRKNLVGLIEGWARVPAELRDAHQLMIVCRLTDARRETLQQVAASHGLPPGGLVLPGAFVPDEDLRALYAACALFVFPSLHEGFGLPLLEAMHCGAPVLAGNNSSLPEVVGRQDALFDPRTPEGIAEAIATTLGNPAKLAALRAHAPLQAAKFSWDISASRALDGFEGAHARAQHAATARIALPARERLAVVLGKGAAFDSEHLLLRFAQHYDLELIADDGRDGWAGARYARRSLAWFDANHDRYARVLYVPGADDVDAAWLARMEQKPGVLVLPALHAGEAALRARHQAAVAAVSHAPDAMLAELVDIHGWRVVLDAKQTDAATLATRLPWTRDLLALAKQVLVTDPVVRQEARSWYGDELAQTLQVVDAADHGAFIAAIEAAPQALPAPHVLYVDVTMLASQDLRTGIERVVRSVLAALPAQTPPGWVLAPVRATDEGYIHASRLVSEWLDLPVPLTRDGQTALPGAGDVFLALDWAPARIAEHRPHLQAMRARGVRINVVVYDMLPLQFPQFFPDFVQPLYRAWLDTIIDSADGLVAISQAVADELSTWIDAHPPSPGIRRPAIGWFHLGADIEASLPTAGDDERAAAALAGLDSAARTVLSVGTVEPRKGHAAVLDAFEALWAAGRQVNWLIIGKQGWDVAALGDRLRNHPQAGRHLLWLDQASDAALALAYARADLLLFASYGEGFGLPLIEAAQHNVPILTRDVPVLREVAGVHAAYFGTDTATANGSLDAISLTDALAAWLDGEAVPPSAALPRQTWAGSTRQLLGVVLGQRWHQPPVA